MLRRDGLGDSLELVEQLLVDLQPARGIDDDDVGVHAPRLSHRVRRDLHGVGGTRRKRRGVDALGQHFQLFHRSRPPDIGGHEQRPVALATDEQRELSGRRRLARPLKARQHDDGWR